MTTYEWAWAGGTSVTESPNVIRSGKKIKLSRFLKSTEAFIASEKRKTMIDAELRDQSVAKPGAEAFRKHLGPKYARSLPEARLGFDERNLQKSLFEFDRKPRLTEEFREDRGNHQHSALRQSVVQQLRIFRRIASQEGDPRTGIGGDHSRRDLAIVFHLGFRKAKVNLATKLAHPVVGSRRSQEFQAATNRLGDTHAAGLLRFLQ